SNDTAYALGTPGSLYMGVSTNTPAPSPIPSPDAPSSQTPTVHTQSVSPWPTGTFGGVGFVVALLAIAYERWRSRGRSEQEEIDETIDD
ncbi:MAG TPA: hypothetical protein VFX76_21380, partial [Roseiflexaceae bacterium]|nr:hypothetical protein [Roseiflexaceae bacterium]